MIRLFVIIGTLSLTMVSGFQVFHPALNMKTIGLSNGKNGPTMKLSMQEKDGFEEENENVRRSLMLSLLNGAVAIGSTNAFPSMATAAQTKPQEFTNMGTQAPPPDGENAFIVLDNGVKYKDFRAGSGDEVVKPGSKVFIQCTGRLLNLNGVVFYSTKANNNIDGFGPEPLVFTIGNGEALPGLESAMMGMKKNSIRRIIVPPNLAYDSNNPNLEPKPVNDNDQRALDSVLKNPRRDATVLFDVQVERIK